MAFDPDKHHRRSIRLKGYDYAQAGIYFVTICIQGGVKALGEVDEGEMVLNDSGRIVEEEWHRTAELRQNVRLDAYVVMPNHFHGIMQILGDGDDTTVGARVVGAQRAAPLQSAGERPGVKPGSLGAVVRAFKSAVTRRINLLNDTPGTTFWQRNYYEHIIRNERSLEAIRQYIVQNPANWPQDSLYEG